MMSPEERMFDALKRKTIDSDPSASPARIFDRTTRAVRDKMIASKGGYTAEQAEAELNALRERYIAERQGVLMKAQRDQRNRAVARYRKGPSNLDLALASTEAQKRHPTLFQVRLNEEARELAAEHVAKTRPWLHRDLAPDVSGVASTSAGKKAATYAKMSHAERVAAADADAQLEAMAEAIQHGRTKMAKRLADTFAVAGFEVPNLACIAVAKALRGKKMSAFRRVLRAGMLRGGDSSTDAQVARSRAICKAAGLLSYADAALDAAAGLK